MMTKRLLSCLAFSALLHSMLIGLVGFVELKPPTVGGSSQSTNPGLGTVLVRLRMLDPPSEVARTNDAGYAAKGTRESAAAATGEVPYRPGASPADSVLALLPQHLPLGIDRNEYLPGSRLDVRPRPLEPIALGPGAAPDMDKDHGQVVLILYIGADGGVDYVEVDASDVPASLAESLATTFRTARMHPGIKEAQPVKSRMKVLVEFEAP